MSTSAFFHRVGRSFASSSKLRAMFAKELIALNGTQYWTCLDPDDTLRASC
jgi:hypothetical protein